MSELGSLPRALLAAAEAENRTSWLATVPATVARLARTWSLTVEAPFQPGGQTAWVAPARNRAGADLVLKVAWAHPEALHEAEGLRAWAGHGAVRLHATEAFPDTVGLLLERCRPGTPLTELPELRQDVVVAELLRRLRELPGFGAQKAQIFLALLGKQLGVRPEGWREAAGAYGETESFRSVADITGPESLAKVRAHKQEMKAAAKAAKSAKPSGARKSE